MSQVSVSDSLLWHQTDQIQLPGQLKLSDKDIKLIYKHLACLMVFYKYTKHKFQGSTGVTQNREKPRLFHIFVVSNQPQLIVILLLFTLP